MNIMIIFLYKNNLYSLCHRDLKIQFLVSLIFFSKYILIMKNIYRLVFRKLCHFAKIIEIGVF